MSANKLIAAVGILSAIAGLLGGGLIGLVIGRATASVPATKAPAGVPVNRVETKELSAKHAVDFIGPRDLIRDFQASTIKAEEKYLKKTWIVVGQVLATYPDHISGRPHFALHCGPKGTVNCWCDSGQHDRVSALQEMGSVMVRGECHEYGIFDGEPVIWFRKCEVAKIQD